MAGLALAFSFAVPVAASATGPGAAPRGAVDGSIGLRLADVPVAARDDPRARVYIVDHLAPGTTIHRRIEVSNTTASTVHVVLYPAAATIANGSFLGSAGHTPNDLSMWSSVQPGSTDVPAGARVTATVTVAVPRDAAPGERYGVVWAEARSAAVAGGGVIQVSRVGIRLYISVGPGGPPAPNFTIRSLTAERSPDGHPIVVATVRNNGGRALDMSGTLRLASGPAGLSAGPFPATLGITLAIGDTEPVAVTLDKQLPAGPWDLVVSNPPYIAAAEADALAPEVRDWDPHVALFGEDAVAAVARGAVDVVRLGGALVLEVGDGQAAAVAELLGGLGFSEMRVTPDLAGRERVVEGIR